MRCAVRGGMGRWEGAGRAMGRLVVWCGGTGDERAWLRGAGRAVAVKENGVRALRAAVAAAVATWACSRASTRGRQRSMCVWVRSSVGTAAAVCDGGDRGDTAAVRDAGPRARAAGEQSLRATRESGVQERARDDGKQRGKAGDAGYGDGRGNGRHSPREAYVARGPWPLPAPFLSRGVEGSASRSVFTSRGTIARCPSLPQSVDIPGGV